MEKVDLKRKTIEGTVHVAGDIVILKINTPFLQFYLSLVKFFAYTHSMKDDLALMHLLKFEQY